MISQNLILKYSENIRCWCLDVLKTFRDSHRNLLFLFLPHKFLPKYIVDYHPAVLDSIRTMSKHWIRTFNVIECNSCVGLPMTRDFLVICTHHWGLQLPPSEIRCMTNYTLKLQSLTGLFLSTHLVFYYLLFVVF